MRPSAGTTRLSRSADAPRLGPPAEMSLRVRVNPIACEAHGLCVELLPELIRFDDWGFPLIEQPLVPAELESLARMAESSCPTLAIVIEEVAPVG